MSQNRSLKSMLEARSIAVVGASKTPGSVGEQMMTQLIFGGFDGSIYPVNPRHDEVQGYRCFAALEELPEAVDLALLGVSNRIIEQQLRAAAECGVPSAVIFASGYEEPLPGTPPLTERLARLARDHRMSICGGNCMGFMNFDRGLRALGFSEQQFEPGPITWISHSGSAWGAMLRNRRGLRFNLAISAGQELATTAADYLLYALELPSTKAVAMFIETIRDAATMRQALAIAAERNVPVVVLKVGREPSGHALVTAHSGALAGEDGAYEALFEAYGVLRVATLQEMADTLELLGTGRRATAGGLTTLHDSGGERVLLIDTAADAGTRIAEISEDTKSRLAALLEPGLPAVNPVDAWGTGKDFQRIYLGCMQALLDDPDCGALAFAVDLAGERFSQGYAEIAQQVFAGTGKPFAVLSNFGGSIPPASAAQIRRSGVPIMEGTYTGLLAFRHLFDLRDYQALPALVPPEPVAPTIGARWRERLGSAVEITEYEGLTLLRDYGIPVVEARPINSLDDAMAAADTLDWPLVLKTAAAGIHHKSDVGGVITGIDSRSALETAYTDLRQRLGEPALLQATAPAGVELALGIVRDPQFGPLVMVAGGGVLIEIDKDRRLGLPPLDGVRARRLVDRLAARPLLDGVRGRGPADVDAVVGALVRLSRLALDLGEQLEALDVNPLIAGPEGCQAVDALVLPAGRVAVSA